MCIRDSYSGCSNYRPTKITSNVVDDCFGIRKSRFGIDIEALLMVVVTFGLDFFKRRSNFRRHFIQECSAERIAKVRIIKMTDMTPEAIVTKDVYKRQDDMYPQIPLH